MNKAVNTKEYIQKLENLKLSESSRSRMENSLLEYARFHGVRVELDGRSIEQVPQRTSLFNLFKQQKSMTAFLIAIALVAGGGTSYAAEGSVPGDFLYTIKTEVNENFKRAFTFGVDAEARLQADLLEERVDEAQKLHAAGKLSGETALTVSKNINTQAKVTTEASAKSEATVAAKTNARVQVALQNLLALSDLDASLASEVTATLNASTLSTGTYAISAYLKDVKLRISTLRIVIEKYRAELKASVYTELSAKLDAAELLVAEASTETEAEARATLDEAAALTGEVESKLSTLGQVQVDVSTGVITDINFSIDPMKIDIRAGGEGSGSVSNDSQKTEQTDSNTDAEVDVQLKLDADSKVIDANVESSLEVTTGVRL